MQLVLAVPAFRQCAVQLFSRLEALAGDGGREDFRSGVLFSMCQLADVKVGGRQDEVRDAISQLRRALAAQKPQVRHTLRHTSRHCLHRTLRDAFLSSADSFEFRHCQEFVQGFFSKATSFV